MPLTPARQLHFAPGIEPRDHEIDFVTGLRMNDVELSPRANGLDCRGFRLT